MASSIGTCLLWVGVVLSIVIALYALNGVLMGAMLFVGLRAEATVAVWGGVFVVSLVALAFCAARLWKRYGYFS
jgi:hypothetical protein